MVKWILLVLVVVVLACGTAAYVMLSAAPPAPRGACPTAFAVTPYDTDAIVYLDATALADNKTIHHFDALEEGMLNGSMNKAYADFVSQTGLNPDRDIEHMLITSNFEDLTTSVIFEGRFDQPKIENYVAQFGQRKHFESGDIITFQAHQPFPVLGLAFLDPKHLAISAGSGAETQLLVMADAMKNPNPSLREDMCELGKRVSGAPIFGVGTIGEKVKGEIAQFASRSTEPGAKSLVHLTGWDAAGWDTPDKIHVSLEGQFDSRYNALQALFAFKQSAINIRSELAKVRFDERGRSLPSDLPSIIAVDLMKNSSFSLDGRYVRLGFWLDRREMDKVLAAHGFVAR